jgi:hypothetical protein
MKTIKGDLILKEDTVFNEGIKVEGDIRGYYDLKVCGNLICRNLDCKDIVCWNLDCNNLDCNNLDCNNLDCNNLICRNLDCRDIVLCVSFESKGKVKAKMIIKDRFNIKQKEFDSDGEELT